MTGKAAPVLYTMTRRTYRDSTLDRTYGGLVRASTTDAEDQRLRVEYAALERCYRVYVSSGMIGSIGSVNLDRVDDNFSCFNRSHLAKTERQIADRAAYRRANLALTDKQRIVVDLVVCKDQSLVGAVCCEPLLTDFACYLGENSKIAARNLRSRRFFQLFRWFKADARAVDRFISANCIACRSIFPINECLLLGQERKTYTRCELF